MAPELQPCYKDAKDQFWNSSNAYGYNHRVGYCPKEDHVICAINKVQCIMFAATAELINAVKSVDNAKLRMNLTFRDFFRQHEVETFKRHFVRYGKMRTDIVLSGSVRLVIIYSVI